jgi:hypothetical protein
MATDGVAAPAAILNPLIDAVEQAVATVSDGQYLGLSAMVQHAYISDKGRN